MKTLPTLAAVAVALVLVVSPMVVSAAGSITFTSPTSPTFKGTSSYTIAGTISPAPTQADEVFITVKNPGGQTVDAGNPTVSSGSFSYATSTCGNCADWTAGTYTITATDSYGATGTTYFTFSTTPAFNSTRWILDIARNQTIIERQITDINGNLTGIKANDVTESKDMKGNFTALSSAIGSLQSGLTTLTGDVTTIGSAVSALGTQLTNVQSTLTTINNNVQALNTPINNAATQATNAANAVNSTQTYVLVVAVLAAITLVLELAILVRKLS
jgi:uncharacterized protein YukE